MVFFLSSIKAFHEAKLPGTASKMYNCSEGPLFMLVSLNTALHSISSRSAAFGNIDSGLHIRCNMCWMNIQFRTCSSGANGRNTGEDKHGPVKDGASFDNEKTWRERVSADAKHGDAHAQLGEQDQKEWLRNEKLAIESKTKESPFFTRREKFKNEFLRKIVPWEKLRDTSRTELYRERIVKALVWDLKVTLLVLDSSVLAPYCRICRAGLLRVKS